jgi:hypothetical protein
MMYHVPREADDGSDLIFTLRSAKRNWSSGVLNWSVQRRRKIEAVESEVHFWVLFSSTLLGEFTNNAVRKLAQQGALFRKK